MRALVEIEEIAAAAPPSARAAASEVIKQILEHGAFSDSGLGEEGAAYVGAVLTYAEKAGDHYPVDLRQVAANTFLAPWAAAARDGERLLAHGGTVYASLAKYLQSVAAPHQIERVATREEGVEGFPSFVRRTAGVLQFSVDAFPVVYLDLGEGGALVPRPHPAEGGVEWLSVTGTGLPGQGGVVYPATGEGARLRAQPPQRRGGEAALTPDAKGRRGESYVGDLLQEAAYEVQVVRGLPRSTDLVAKTAAGGVYIEVKNYAATVPEKEVKKFHRDLCARGAPAGVLISLESGVAQVPAGLSIKIEKIAGGVSSTPVAYVCSSHPDLIKGSVAFVAFLAQEFQTAGAVGQYGDDFVGVCGRRVTGTADLLESAQNDLLKAATALHEGLAGVSDKVSCAKRECRQVARDQAAASAEFITGRVEIAAEGLWGAVAQKYPHTPAVQTGCTVLRGALAELSKMAGEVVGAGGWRFMQKRAVHAATGTVFIFSSTVSELCRPIAALSGEKLAAAVQKHRASVRIGDGLLALNLAEISLEDALALF